MHKHLRIIAILLVCIILALSIIDSPEYIHCIHLDLPGSLDLHAIVFDIIKVDIISKCSYEIRDSFFSILEDSLDHKESVISLFFLAYHLLSFLIGRRNTDLGDPALSLSVLVEQPLISNVPNLIGISVIRS